MKELGDDFLYEGISALIPEWSSLDKSHCYNLLETYPAGRIKDKAIQEFLSQEKKYAWGETDLKDLTIVHKISNPNEPDLLDELYDLMQTKSPEKKAFLFNWLDNANLAPKEKSLLKEKLLH